MEREGEQRCIPAGGRNNGGAPMQEKEMDDLLIWGFFLEGKERSETEYFELGKGRWGLGRTSFWALMGFLKFWWGLIHIGLPLDVADKNSILL